MADLRDRGPEAGEPLLLLERRGQLHLEILQRRLGLADLLGAAPRRDDAARVLGVLAVARHRVDHPVDRADDEPLHGEKQQRRRGERDRQRDVEDAAALFDHRGAERLLVEGDLDLAALARRADHPDDAVAAAEKDAHGVAHPVEGVGLGQVVGALDHRRGRARQHQFADVLAAQRDVDHARGVEELLLEVGRNLLIGRGREDGERRHLAEVETRLQIVGAETRHRGHEEQHLRDYHEDGHQR